MRGGSSGCDTASFTGSVRAAVVATGADSTGVGALLATNGAGLVDVGSTAVARALLEVMAESRAVGRRTSRSFGAPIFPPSRKASAGPPVALAEADRFASADDPTSRADASAGTGGRSASAKGCAGPSESCGRWSPPPPGVPAVAVTRTLTSCGAGRSAGRSIHRPNSTSTSDAAMTARTGRSVDRRTGIDVGGGVGAAGASSGSADSAGNISQECTSWSCVMTIFTTASPRFSSANVSRALDVSSASAFSFVDIFRSITLLPERVFGAEGGRPSSGQTGICQRS